MVRRGEGRLSVDSLIVIQFSAKRSPVKTKESSNADKKLELEKRLESVQNALNATQAKRMKPG